MAATNSPLLRVTCSACGAEYQLPISMAGRRGPCAKCGASIVVPNESLQDSAPAVTRRSASKPKQKAETPRPQYASVDCRVCQTRLTGRIEQVGQELKCPDCGARTVLPAPPKPKAKKLPAALDGEQYELWGVDEAPLPSELAKRQPKYIAIECRLCQTLMHATEQQVGATIACPDCGTRHVVPALEAQPPRSAIANDEDPFVIDPSLDPGERPAVILPPVRRMLYEEEAEAERARAAEAARRGKAPKRDARGRPIMPSEPLLSGMIPFLLSPGLFVRWLILTIVLVGTGWLLVAALSMAAAGGFGAIGGMSFFAISCILGIAWFAGLASIFIAVVTESSEGNDQVYNWPSAYFFDWLPELGYLFIAVMVSAFPGWLIGQVAINDPLIKVALFFGGIVVCLPIVLLSQLDITSPWGALSGRILASFARCPVSWTIFYAEVGLLAGGCVALTLAASMFAEALLILLVPLLVACLLIYARLIGRLGWKLAETMATSESGEDDD